MCVSNIKRDRVAVSYLLNNRPASMMIKNANNENVNEAITEAENAVVTADTSSNTATSMAAAAATSIGSFHKFNNIAFLKADFKES